MTMRIQEGIIVPAQDQQYQNFIVRYNQNLHGDFDYESDDTFQIVNDLFGILYVPEQDVPALEFNSYSYSSIPKCYTYMDLGASERIWRTQASRSSIPQIKRSRNTGGGH